MGQFIFMAFATCQDYARRISQLRRVKLVIYWSIYTINIHGRTSYWAHCPWQSTQGHPQPSLERPASAAAWKGYSSPNWHPGAAWGFSGGFCILLMVLFLHRKPWAANYPCVNTLTFGSSDTFLILAVPWRIPCSASSQLGLLLGRQSPVQPVKTTPQTPGGICDLMPEALEGKLMLFSCSVALN